MCVKHGIDVIFHASWTDEEGMDMLEKNKEKLMVVPAINWVCHCPRLHSVSSSLY